MARDLPSASGLTGLMAATERQGLPPVERWNSSCCGDGFIAIRRWFHQGVAMTRAGVIRLFSRCPRKHDDAFMPAERVFTASGPAP